MGILRGFWWQSKKMQFLFVFVVLLVILFTWWRKSVGSEVSSTLLVNTIEVVESNNPLNSISKAEDVLSNNIFPPVIEKEAYVRTSAGRVFRQDLTEERKERDSRIKAPKTAAKNQDWEQFIAAVDNLHDMPDIVLHNTISSAILHNAPIYVFEELLARGASFLGRHTVMLAMYDNLPLMKKLIFLGLDIHGVNYQGNNAINGLLVSFSSREALNFLLSNGVEIQNGKNDVDPLMLALLKAETDKEAAYYAFMLVKYDTEVTTGHIAQVEKISERNPEAYQLLVAYISEFR
jgi:hypothetical protein